MKPKPISAAVSLRNPVRANNVRFVKIQHFLLRKTLCVTQSVQFRMNFSTRRLQGIAGNFCSVVSIFEVQSTSRYNYVTPHFIRTLIYFISSMKSVVQIFCSQKVCKCIKQTILPSGGLCRPFKAYRYGWFQWQCISMFVLKKIIPLTLAKKKYSFLSYISLMVLPGNVT